MLAMNYGVKTMIDLLLNTPIDHASSFGDFIRNLDFSFDALASKVVSIFDYYIYVHGYKAILVIIALVYIILISFSVTRGLASLALNTIFSQPFAVARDIVKGASSALGGTLKIIISAIRDSRNDK